MAYVETKYKVNKEKRVVVCIITTVDEVTTRLWKYGFYEFFPDKGDVRIYKGIAKCAPEDEWDEAYGKKLAEYRAQRQRRGDVNKDIRDYMKRVRRNLRNLRSYGFIASPKDPDEKRVMW